MHTKTEPSLLAFFILVIALTIPFWILAGLRPVQILPGLPLSALAAVVPGLAALILVYRAERGGGVRRLLARAFDFRRIQSRAWLAAAILINPAIAALAYIVLRAGGAPIPGPAPFTLIILPLFVGLFIFALGEELGWSGCAAGPLLRRWGVLPAGLLLGAVWAAWHVIALIQAGRSVEWIAWWSLATIALRVIMVCLFVQTGQSVFAMAVFHALSNLCWQLFPVNGSYYDPQVFGLITVGVAVVVYAIVRRKQSDSRVVG